MKQLLKKAIALHYDQLNGDDIKKVRQLLGGHVDANLLIDALQTIVTGAEEIAPDRSMALAWLLFSVRSEELGVRSSYLSQVEQLFGSDIAHLTEGLAKVAVAQGNDNAVKDDNYHKLLLTLAQDIRVILMMIADRLRRIRLLASFSSRRPTQTDADYDLAQNKFRKIRSDLKDFENPTQAGKSDIIRSKGENQTQSDPISRNLKISSNETILSKLNETRIAEEARFIYAPLAHRLGLYSIKTELEDLSLKCLNYKVYSQIAHKLSETKEAREKYIKDFIEPIREALDHSGLKYTIKGRTKSINSIWNKMKNKGVDLNGIYDLFAIRIILDSEPKNEKKDCWVAYSIVTDIYTANPARFKDWITVPKSNGYESLHITVNGPQSKWVEVQIRTTRMDEVAERGLAAHWKYKGIKSEGSLDAWMNNVREALETHTDIQDLSANPYAGEIFVFTPKGDLFRLPQGASVLDFAFHIHTSVGAKCVGGRIDDKNQKINYKLHSGDTVEIITSSTQTPRLDWLNFVVTSKARNKIKQAVNEARTKQAELGREALQRRFKNRKIEIDDAQLARLTKKLGYKSATDFLVAIHQGTLDASHVVDEYETFVQKQNEAVMHGSAQEFVLQTGDANAAAESDDILVIGSGVKGINYKLSKCCNPIYGDRVTGFIASDGAIKIHRTDCGNIRHLAEKYPYRVIRAQWSGKLGNQFAATLKVVGRDDIGIVASISSVINKTADATLRSIQIQSQNGMFEGYLGVGVKGINMLDDIIKKIEGVRGVKQVIRV